MRMKSSGLSSLDKFRDKLVAKEKIDEWDEVQPYFGRISTASGSDTVTVRFFMKNDKGRHYMTVGLGKDVADLMKIEKGSRLRVLRNRLRGSLVKLVPGSGRDGFAVYGSNEKCTKLYAKARVPWDDKLLCDETKNVNFDIDDTGLTIDISEFMGK